jgi:hypothetical protein
LTAKKCAAPVPKTKRRKMVNGGRSMFMRKEQVDRWFAEQKAKPDPSFTVNDQPQAKAPRPEFDGL